MITLLKRYDFSASLLRNSVIQIIWWIIFFPGFFSGDSFGAAQMATSGELTNAFTASWALYVRIFSFHGNAIGLLTLINGLLLTYSVTRFAFSILNRKIASITSFLLTLSPIVAGMGITLWHDILMTAGLLLVVSFFTDLMKGIVPTRTQLIWQLALGSILISFRPNGLPTLIAFSLLILIINWNKSLFKFAISSILVSTAVTLVGSNIILGMSPINEYYAQEWMRNDISCFANTPAGDGFVEGNIPGIGTTESWKSQAACTFLNKAEISGEEKAAAQQFVPSAWLTLVRQKPAFVLETHLRRNAYLLPIPLFGIPKTPFLHSTIEFKDRGIEWIFPTIAEKARAPMRVWNALRGVTGWAGLWTLITLLLLVISRKRILLPAALMSISLLGILFVVSPIPDGRYALFALIAGQIAFVGKAIEWASKTPPLVSDSLGGFK